MPVKSRPTEAPLSPDVVVATGLVGVAKRVLFEHALVLIRAGHPCNGLESLLLDPHAAGGIRLQALADELCETT